LAITIGDWRLSLARERQMALEKSPKSFLGGTLKGTSGAFSSSRNALPTSSRIIDPPLIHPSLLCQEGKRISPIIIGILEKSQA
jgi:hypothetical protein